MRAIPMASVALLSAGALALGSPVASAAVTGDPSGNITSFGFSVTPSTVQAGGQVKLKADGCDKPVIVTSGVFDTVTIPKGDVVSAKVDWDAKPGASYTVTFDCKGEKGTTDLTIAAGGNNQTTTGGNIHRGVKAGIGGSFGDLNLGELALGAALIVGALGSAVYWARRRTGEDDA
ncbi:hypothetical protein [Streptomyces apocyni]|uniref:hypothetical protein n=1 Tax=Streptomyces apocyni TaxID=2654677 RepID=UPI0012E9D3FB|nr:hypothetical protein [Streptomyces apocyni]